MTFSILRNAAAGSALLRQHTWAQQTWKRWKRFAISPTQKSVYLTIPSVPDFMQRRICSIVKPALPRRTLVLLTSPILLCPADWNGMLSWQPRICCRPFRRWRQPSIAIGIPPALKSMRTGAGKDWSVHCQQTAKPIRQARCSSFSIFSPTPTSRRFWIACRQSARFAAITAILSLLQPVPAKP